MTELESKPIPDPTALTGALVDRAILSLRAELVMQMSGMKDVTKEIQLELKQIPILIERSTQHLESLHAEKFKSIQSQFDERDVRVEQTARDTKVAVDAALMAAEKAVGKQTESFSLSIDKSERSVVKLLDQQGDLIRTSTDALKENIADIKERVARIESAAVGSAMQKSDAASIQTRAQTGNSFVLSMVMGAVGVISLIITIIVTIIMIV